MNGKPKTKRNSAQSSSFFIVFQKTLILKAFMKNTLSDSFLGTWLSLSDMSHRCARGITDPIKINDQDQIKISDSILTFNFCNFGKKAEDKPPGTTNPCLLPSSDQQNDEFKID